MMELGSRGVASIEVGVRLLTALADCGAPMRLRDAAAAAGLTQGQAHAYAVSFRRLGLVEQTEDGLYQIGPSALQLGIARLRSFDPLRMAASRAAEIAAEKALMVTVSVWGAHGPTVVQVHEPGYHLHVNVRVGTIFSIGGSATGRVFAAFMPDSIVAPVLETEIREGEASRRSGRSLPMRQLARELEEVRRNGFAVARGAPIPGVNALSAPVFDYTGQVQFALTLIALAPDLDTSPGGPAAAELLDETRDMSARLGWTSVAAISPGKGSV